MDAIKNLLSGAANKAIVGFVSAALPIVLAKTGLNLSGCEGEIVSWGQTLVAAAVVGLGGGASVYAVRNKPAPG